MFLRIKNYIKCHKEEAILFFILLAAIFFRLIFFKNEVAVISDSVVYAKAGESLIERGSYEAFGKPEILFPPGFSVAVGISNKFFHNLVFSLRAVSLIFGVLTVYLSYFVAKELHSKKAGLFASFFIATNPSLIAYSQEVFCESMYLFFALLAFYIYLKMEKKYSTLLAAALGISIGYSFLIKPEAMLMLVLPLMYSIRNIKNNPFKSSTALLTVIVSAVFVLLPYLMFIKSNTGKITISAKTYSSLVYGLILNGVERSRIDNAKLDEYEKYEGNYNEEKNILEFPEEYRSLNIINSLFDPKFFEKYVNGFLSEILSLWEDHGAKAVLLLAALSFFFAARKKILAKYLPLFFLMAMPAFLFPLFHIESRYVLQILIFVFIFASMVCCEDIKLSSRIFAAKNRKVRRISLGALAAVVVLMEFVLFLSSNVSFASQDRNCEGPICIKNPAVRERLFPNHIKSQNSSWFEYKIAGEYIKNNSDSKNTIVMSRRPFEISFYAGLENSGIMLPYAGVDDIIKFAKKNRVNYIVTDERFLSIRENYNELLALDSFSQDIGLVFEDNSISPIRVFKIVSKLQ